METRQIVPTRWIGISRSVRATNLLFASRCNGLLKADKRPSQIGLASFVKVQMAAIPIVPAPMNRTWVRQIEPATSAAEPDNG